MRRRDGQGLVFAALTLFLLTALVAHTADFALLVSEKVRNQGAADAAAYSAALVRAEGAAAVAAMNQVMVWLARTALGLVAATVTLGVLVALNAVLPGAFVWAVPLFARAVSLSVEWLPRLRAWSERIARAEDRLASAVPALAALEADRIARANGAKRALLLPLRRLPVAPEPDRGRFLSKVTGGAVPAWAVSRLFGGASEGYSRSHSAPDARGGTRGATRSEGDLGQGVPDAATREKTGRFREILRQAAKDPWPLPRVLSAEFDAEKLTVTSFPSDGATFRLPFTAAARAFHPKVGPPGAAASPENLYAVGGWQAELLPVGLPGAEH